MVAQEVVALLERIRFPLGTQKKGYRMKYEVIEFGKADENDIICVDSTMNAPEVISFAAGLNLGIIKEEDFLWFGKKEDYLYCSEYTWVIRKREGVIKDLPKLGELMEEKKAGAVEKAFEAIRGEVKYQDELWGNEPSGGIHSVVEWILFIQNYLREAEEVVSRKPSPKCDEEALHVMRKIATMAVRCMEQNGILFRDMRDLDRACELHGVNCEEE